MGPSGPRKRQIPGRRGNTGGWVPYGQCTGQEGGTGLRWREQRAPGRERLSAPPRATNSGVVSAGGPDPVALRGGHPPRTAVGARALGAARVSCSLKQFAVIFGAPPPTWGSCWEGGSEYPCSRCRRGFVRTCVRRVLRVRGGCRFPRQPPFMHTQAHLCIYVYLYLLTYVCVSVRCGVGVLGFRHTAQVSRGGIATQVPTPALSVRTQR